MSDASLIFKAVAIDAYMERVVFVHRECPLFRVEGFQSLARVEVRSATKRLSAVLLIADDTTVVGLNEVGLSSPSLELLDVSPGELA